MPSQQSGERDRRSRQACEVFLGRPGIIELTVIHPVDEFRLFVDEANQILRTPSHTPTISAFSAFIHEAERIIVAPTSAPPVAEFQQFVTAAMPLIVAEIKCLLPWLAERAALADRWYVRHDLLSIAGSRLVENSYTELMEWALRPATHPPSAQRRQQSWLKAIGLDENICGEAACIPQTQLVTDDGIPDLVLQFERSTVVIEAKTGSLEHAAPSQKPQTIAYEESVPKTLKLTSDHKIEVVFITPDRREAKNPRAKVTTFIEFAFALASVLDDEQMPADARAAYAMLFTHFLTSPNTTSVPVREVIDSILAWSKQPDWSADEKVLRRMDELLEAVEILIPEEAR
jgi:hypothetical protein